MRETLHLIGCVFIAICLVAAVMQTLRAVNVPEEFWLLIFAGLAIVGVFFVKRVRGPKETAG